MEYSNANLGERPALSLGLLSARRRVIVPPATQLVAQHAVSVGAGSGPRGSTGSDARRARQHLQSRRLWLDLAPPQDWLLEAAGAGGYAFRYTSMVSFD